MSKDLISDLEGLNAKDELENKTETKRQEQNNDKEPNIVDLYVMGDLAAVKQLVQKEVIKVVSKEISSKE